jgi:penicillin amidase
MQSIWLENILRHQPKRWLPDAYSNYDELLTAAVEAAVRSSETPGNLNLWKWGKNNAVEIRNPILSAIPVLNQWTAPGIQPQSGSGYTVKAVTRSHGPSERFTVDFSDLDHSTLNLVTGQSGNFLSPYYLDQWKAWYEGFTFELPFSRQAIKRTQTHKLLMEPSREPQAEN